MTRPLTCFLPITALMVLALLFVGCSSDDNGTEPPKTGSIQITSNPSGATIFVDDVNMQRTTPATLTNVTPGSREVRLELSGYEDFTTNVSVTAGQTATVNATMVSSSPKGTLVINSTPTGATIWLDGANTGQTTNHTFTDVDAGNHSVVLKLTNYADYSTNVNVTANQTTTLNATMTSTTYTLDITTAGTGTVHKSPDKAEYSLNEQVTITATPGTDWNFFGWQGDLDTTLNPITITMDGDKEIAAVFSSFFYVYVNLDFGGTDLVRPVAFLDTSSTEVIRIYRDLAFLEIAEDTDSIIVGFEIAATETVHAIVTGWDDADGDSELEGSEPQGWYDFNGDQAWNALDFIEFVAGESYGPYEIPMFDPAKAPFRTRSIQYNSVTIVESARVHEKRLK